MKKKIIVLSIVLVMFLSVFINILPVFAATFNITFTVNNSDFGYLNNLKTSDYTDLVIENDSSGNPTKYTLPLNSDKAGSTGYNYTYSSNAFTLGKTAGAKPKSADYEFVAWANENDVNMSSMTFNQNDNSGNEVNRFKPTGVTKATNFTAYFKPVSTGTKTIKYTYRVGGNALGTGDGGTITGGTVPIITNGIGTSGTITTTEAYDYVTDTKEYIKGATAKVIKSGYYFAYWYDASTNIVVSTDLTFTPSGDQIKEGVTYVAQFLTNGTKRVIIRSNNSEWGRVKRGSTDYTDKVITYTYETDFKAVPANGYELEHWELNGNRLTYTGEVVKDSSGELKSDEFTVTEKTGILTAFFQKKYDYTINYEAGEGGSVDNQEDKMNDGEVATGSTAIPNKGYEFVGWYKGETLLEGIGEEFRPTGNYLENKVTYTAKFKVKEYDYNITYEAGVGGTVSNTEDKLDEGDNATGAKAIANAGYKFLGWYEGDTLLEGVGETFKPTGEYLKNNVTYTAKFQASDITINYKAVYYATSTNFPDLKNSSGENYATNLADYLYKDEEGNIDSNQVVGSNLNIPSDSSYYFGYWVEVGNTTTGTSLDTGSKIISYNEKFIPTGEQIKNTTYMAMFFKKDTTNSGDYPRYVFDSSNYSEGSVYITSTPTSSTNDATLRYNQRSKKSDNGENWTTNKTVYAISKDTDKYQFAYWEINGVKSTIETTNTLMSGAIMGSTSDKTQLYVIKAVFKKAPRVKYRVAYRDSLDNAGGGNYVIVDNPKDESLPGATATPTSNHYLSAWIALKYTIDENGNKVYSTDIKSNPVVSTNLTFIPTENDLKISDTFVALYYDINGQYRVVFITNNDEAGSIYNKASRLESEKVVNKTSIAANNPDSNGKITIKNTHYAGANPGYVFDHWEINGKVLYVKDGEGNDTDEIYTSETLSPAATAVNDTKIVVKAVFKMALPNTGSNESLIYIIIGIQIIIVASVGYIYHIKRKRQVR